MTHNYFKVTPLFVLPLLHEYSKFYTAQSASYNCICLSLVNTVLDGVDFLEIA